MPGAHAGMHSVIATMAGINGVTGTRPKEFLDRLRIPRQYAVILAAAVCTAVGYPSPPAPAQDLVETVRIAGTDVRFKMRTIPPGRLELDGTIHEIGALAVCTTEITWDVYDIYLYGLDQPESDDTKSDGVSRPTKPYVPPDRGYGHAGYPAMGMTRLAAVRFCEWLSRKTGETYRLPTRTEWIYFAEAGAGHAAGATASAAWYEENADYTTHPVGEKAPNDWGIHDTLGNVAEWIAPEHGQRPQDTPTAMGGSFLEPTERCTTRTPMSQDPFWNSSDPQIPKSRWWLADCDFVGFRIVRERSASANETHIQPARPEGDR